MTISYTETFDLYQAGGIPDLALDTEVEERLRDALDTSDGPEIRELIEQQITAQLRIHGVDTDTDEWRGQWSATDIVVAILNRHYCIANVNWTTRRVGIFQGPAMVVEGGIGDVDLDDEDGADEQRRVVLAALAELGYEPIRYEEWVDIAGGLGSEAGGLRVPVRRTPR
jgi:hypothetical protein